MDGSTIVAFGAGGGLYPYGSLVLAVGYAGNSVIFTGFGVPVGPEPEVTDGKERLFVIVLVFSGDVAPYVGLAPNSLSGIAVPNPLLVQGVGTGKREVTGLACGVAA